MMNGEQNQRIEDANQQQRKIRPKISKKNQAHSSFMLSLARSTGFKHCVKTTSNHISLQKRCLVTTKQPTSFSSSHRTPLRISESYKLAIPRGTGSKPSSVLIRSFKQEHARYFGSSTQLFAKSPSQSTIERWGEPNRSVFFLIYRFIVISIGIFSIILVLLLVFFIYPSGTIGASGHREVAMLQSFQDTRLIYRSTPTVELYKRLLILNLCDRDWFLNLAQYIVDFISDNKNSDSWARKLMRTLIKHSFYQHFCAGMAVVKTISQLIVTHTTFRYKYLGETLEEVVSSISSNPLFDLDNVTAILDRTVEGSFSPHSSWSGNDLDSNAQHVVSLLTFLTSSRSGSLPPSASPLPPPFEFPNKAQFVSVKVSALAPVELLQKITQIIHSNRSGDQEISLKDVTNHLSDSEKKELDSIRY
jgi:hypothetical protein